RGQRPVQDLPGIQLDPVAGAEDDCLAAEASIQFIERARQLIAVERDAFTDLHRRVAKAATDNVENHGPTPCPRGWASARQHTRSAKATIVRKAACLPRRRRP